MTWREEILADGVRIINADCREVLPTLGKIDAVVTDPPYGMRFQSNHRAIKYDPIANDTTDKLLQWVARIDVVHSKYIFGRWENLRRLPKPKSVVIWIKNNWSMGDLEHEHGRQTELLFFYPGPEHDWPKDRPTDVVKGIRTANSFHPTEKPVDVMMRICGFTRGTILDPFMGSGTTGVASVRLARPFVGIEVDPKHFDIACRRIGKALKQGEMFVEMQKVPQKVPKPHQESWHEMWKRP